MFAAGTTIAGHAYLVVWLGGESGEGPLHADFALAAGGALQLAAPDGTSPGARTLAATAADESLVYDASTDAFAVSDAPTPGATNPGGY